MDNKRTQLTPMDNNGTQWTTMDENIRGATCISDAIFHHYDDDINDDVDYNDSDEANEVSCPIAVLLRFPFNARLPFNCRPILVPLSFNEPQTRLMSTPIKSPF